VGLYGTLTYATDLLKGNFLWLAKAYVIPTGLYGFQVRGSEFLREGGCIWAYPTDFAFEFLKGHPRSEAVCAKLDCAT